MKNRVLLVLIIFVSSIYGQERETLLKGNLSSDSRIAFEASSAGSSSSVVIETGQDKKSPALAGIMSLVIPGSGEFYAESYWKSALFIAIEAAAITMKVVYDKKGDDQTAEFESYAHSYWSPYRYALWTVTNLTTLNPTLDAADYNVLDGNSEFGVNWAELNRMESDIGGYYSHRLEEFGEQQYYEMIGKYTQFNPGWDDFGDENTPYVYGDPVTEKFTYYSGLRGEANDFYSVAKTAMIVVVTNHILSAIDAAWTAGRYNKSIEMGMRIEKREYGFRRDYYPTLDMKINF